MGFMDNLKAKSQEVMNQVQDSVNNSVGKIEQSASNKQEERDQQRELKAVFNPTNTMGEISIDSNNRLFKCKHASANIKKKKNVAAQVTLATMTAGASLVASQMMKPSDKVFRFDEIRSFELLEDDSTVVSGGVGMALAGEVFFGGAGALAGSQVGARTTKKNIENLVLKINMTDLDFPCVMITFINKKTEIDSNSYRTAISKAQETISCLELIVSQCDESKEVVSEEKLDKVKKLKELVDLGVISEEEFEEKKNQLLNF